MKAIVISQPGPPEVLVLKEIDDPQPAIDELLVRVEATAVNRADLLQRVGVYPAPPGIRPDVPGLEFAGRVESAPAGSEYNPGDRVMGLLSGAGYAEKVVVPAAHAIPVPETWSWEKAAAVPEVFLTAYDALNLQLGVAAGERVLIHAVASGVGSAALQLAKTLGAEVFGTAGGPEKLAALESLGLDHAIDRHREDFREVLERLTQGRGVDAVFDLVGGSYWERNLQVLAERGRLILIGLVGGRTAETDLGLILRKRLKVMGTVLRPRSREEKAELIKRFREQVMPLFAKGRLKPVIDRVFSLEQAADAHRYVESNRNVGKVVLRLA